MIDIKRWFRIEKDEREWVILLAVAVMFIVAANVILFDILLAFMVKRAGVRYVPYFYAMSSIMLSVGAWITLGPMRRLRTIFQGILFAVVATVGAVALACAERYVPAGAGLTPVFAFTAFGLFVNSVAISGLIDKMYVTESDVFNIEQLQRLDPIVTSAATVSSFLGGLLLAWLSENVVSWVLYGVVAVLLACGTCAIALLFRRAKRDRMLSVTAPLADIEEQGSSKKMFDPFDGAGTAPMRRFLLLMSLFIVVGMVLIRIYGYQFNIAADARFASEAELNAFYGAYTAASSIAALIFVNTVRRYLIAKYGILRNMVGPLGVSLASLAAIAAFPVFSVVIVAMFIRDLAAYLQFAFDFFLQGMSDYLRNRSAAWLNGPISTIGGLLGSALLIAVTAIMPKGVAPALMLRVLAVLAACFLVLQIVIALRLRGVFFPLLRSAVAEGDFKTRLRAIESMVEARFAEHHDCGPLVGVVADESAPSALRIAGLKTIAAMGDTSCLRMVDKFITHPDLALRREAIRTVASFPIETAKRKPEAYLVRSLIDALRTAFVAETVPDAMDDILDALVRFDGASITGFLAEQLRTASPARAASILRALRRVPDRAIAGVVRPFLSHADPYVREQAAAVLWRLPGERDAAVQTAVKDLIAAAPGSAEHRAGAYLVGALLLRQEAPRIEKELADGMDPETRLIAAIALLKLGREAGLRELERVLRTGTKEQAFEVERLAEHAKVPEEQRARIKSLIHKWHLHYPLNLPVSEPLRVRLHDIPRACLEKLLPYYSNAAAASNRRKILAAMENGSFSETTGKVALVHLDGTWMDMAAVALLAHGYDVRQVADGFTRETGEIAVGNEGDAALGQSDIILSHRFSVEDRMVAKSHFAPSELLAAVDRMRKAGDTK